MLLKKAYSLIKVQPGHTKSLILGALQAILPQHCYSDPHEMSFVERLRKHANIFSWHESAQQAVAPPAENEADSVRFMLSVSTKVQHVTQKPTGQSEQASLLDFRGLLLA